MTIIRIPVAIASISIVSYGARLGEASPKFDQWFQAVTADMHLVDGVGLGVMLSTWWVFVMFYWIIGIAFLIAILTIRIKFSGREQVSSTFFSQWAILKIFFTMKLAIL